jgi:hypothetical protein
MPGRSDAEERSDPFPTSEGLGGGEAGSRGAGRGRERSGRHAGVGVDGSTPLFAQCFEGVDERRRVRPSELFARRCPQGERDERVGEISVSGALGDGGETGDAFRMSRTGIMTGEGRVVGHQEHRPRVTLGGSPTERAAEGR